MRQILFYFLLVYGAIAQSQSVGQVPPAPATAVGSFVETNADTSAGNNVVRFFNAENPAVPPPTSNTNTISNTPGLHFQHRQFTTNDAWIYSSLGSLRFEARESIIHGSGGTTSTGLSVSDVNGISARWGQTDKNWQLSDAGLVYSEDFTNVKGMRYGGDYSSFLFLDGDPRIIPDIGMVREIVSDSIVGGGGGGAGVSAQAFQDSISSLRAIILALNNRVANVENELSDGKHRFVFVGASIMDQMLAIRDLQAVLSDSFPRATIEIVDFATSGATTQTKASQLVTEISTLPAPGSDGFKTYFFIHIGGNNVTDSRPFSTVTAQEQQDFVDGLQSIKATILSAGFALDDIHFQQLTWRNYGLDNSAFNDESLGSDPYNNNFLDTLTNPAARHASGRPYWNLYVWSLNNRDLLDNNDPVHFGTAGEIGMQDYFLNSSARFHIEGVVPEELVKDTPGGGGGGETVVVSFGNYANNSFAGGINEFNSPGYGATTTVGTSTISNVRNTSNELTSISLTLTATDANSSGRGNAGDVSPSISNDQLLSQSAYAGGNNNLVIQISGLLASTNFTIKLAGSRSATDGRTQTFRVTGAPDVTGYDIGRAVPVDIVTIQGTTTSSGTITITVIPTNGVGFCYLNGFELTTP